MNILFGDKNTTGKTVERCDRKILVYIESSDFFGKNAQHSGLEGTCNKANEIVQMDVARRAGAR